MHSSVKRVSQTRVARVGLAVALGASALVVTASASNAAAPKCGPAAFAAEATGAPTVVAAGPLGYRIWNDKGVWQVRVTHPEKGKNVSFSGTITSTGRINARAIKLERGDSVRFGKQGKSMSFTLRNAGGIDGLVIGIGCATGISFDLKVNAAPASLGQIALGKDLVAPQANPVAFTGTPTLATDKPKPTPAACTNGTLPAEVQGKPAIAGKGFNGYRVWHDSSGWHVRVTHPGTSKVTYTGEIRLDRAVNLSTTKLESGDSVRFADMGRVVRFTLRNYGGIDGLNVGGRCAAKITMTLKTGGVATPLDQIGLGAGSAAPQANPVFVTRTAS